MKKPLATILVCLFFIPAICAQNNNPLIYSGEVINKGIQLYDAGKYKEALALYRQVNRNDTNYVWALYESALSLAADSQYNAAIHACELAMAEKADAERLPDLLTEYGSLLDNTGQAARALVIFDSALQRYPAHTVLYLNKGTTLLRQDRYQEAAQVFRQAVMQDPYAASCHFKLGIATLQTGHLVPAMLSFIHYLLLSPDGRYSSNCIALLSAIAQNTDEIKQYINNRTEDPQEEYRLTEQIIQSKIALDKNYKPVIELDDAISRQMQVLFEKLSYDSESKDFWMQYYVPYYKNVFNSGQFEALVNYIFSDVKLPLIQSYNKKRKKEIQALENDAVAYFNKIRATRELDLNRRKTANGIYYFENGKLAGIGKHNEKGDKFIGDWKFCYPAGNTRSTGRFNEEGQKEGNWTYYYPDGTLKATQAFTDGKQNGPEIFYFINGQTSSEATYANDNLHAEGNTFYFAGARNITAQYINGKLNGERRAYFSNDNLHTIENFTNEKKNGKYLSYYKNGLPEAEAVYVNGELDGPYKTWHSNGKLAAEGAYSKDKSAGTWKKYHENGALKSTQSFQNGKEEGEYVELYDNGQLFTKYQYQKGMLNGEVIYNDDDGKPFSALVFENNKIISARYIDKSGKELSRSSLKDNKIDLLSFFPDGSKKMQATYNSKGNTEGTETRFYHSGGISQTSTYSNGELNGPSASYYLNGQKISQLAYAGDKKDGYFKSFYFSGGLESEGWYKDNEAVGQWLNYDLLGNPSAISYFLNDQLHGYKQELYPNGKTEFSSRYQFGWLQEMVQYDTAGSEICRIKLDKGNGIFKGLHLNGRTRFEGNYVQGFLDGPYHFYFFDNSKQVVQFYKRGEEDSIYRSYHYGGQLNAEGQFSQGKKTGTWKFYRKNGTLGNTEEYTNGESNGHNISYFENGKKDLDITYKNDERNGLTLKYEPGGALAYQINYKGNLPQSYTYQGKDGKLVPEIPFTAGSGMLRSWYANGQLATEHSYKEGKINGTYRLYYPNGKIWKERTDSFDISNGPATEYYETGQLKASYQYLNDNLHGPFRLYYANGQVKEEGNYYIGNYHGNIRLYDEKGKLVETQLYYYGRLLSVKK